MAFERCQQAMCHALAISAYMAFYFVFMEGSCRISSRFLILQIETSSKEKSIRRIGVWDKTIPRMNRSADNVHDLLLAERVRDSGQGKVPLGRKHSLDVR